MKALKIATFNINGIRSQNRAGHASSAVEQFEQTFSVVRSQLGRRPAFSGQGGDR